MMVSIITPTFNADGVIETTIKSVLEQECVDFEYIIMDGLSNDNTKKICTRYMKKNDAIRWFSEKDKGIYDAMNKAVLVAKGDYCIFLGAGDTFCNSKVLKEMKKHLCEGNLDVVYGYVIAHKDGYHFPLRRKLDFLYTVRFLPVCHQAVFAKRELLLKHPFDTTIKIAADQDWLMHMQKLKRKMSYVDLAIANYTYDGVSSSAKGQQMYIEEQSRIHRQYYPIRGWLIDSYRKIKNKIR